MQLAGASATNLALDMSLCRCKLYSWAVGEYKCPGY